MAKKEQIQSAEVVKTSTGKQYHIGVGPGEVAPYVLLCGDPERVKKISKNFDKINVKASSREFITHTGVYQGMPITALATGIGCGNTEIAVIELLQCLEGKNPVLIRVGSCGALQKETQLGDLIITTGGVRLETTSTFFVPEGFPAIAHHEVIFALINAAIEKKYNFQAGTTATAPGFYGAQGRNVPGFPPRFPNLLDQLANIGVLNFEMETTTLLTLSTLAKVRAGTVCAVYAKRSENVFVSPKLKKQSEMNCIKTGLLALKNLYNLDNIRKEKNNPHWHPLLEK